MLYFKYGRVQLNVRNRPYGVPSVSNLIVGRLLECHLTHFYSIVHYSVYDYDVFLTNVQMAHSKPQNQTRLENLRDPILRYRHNMPKMLLYGDSHIVRLEEWINQPYKKSNIFGPTPLDHIALNNIEVCAVGGTRFDTVHEKVCGIGVPVHQKRQGNQWDHVVNTLKLQPATVIISMGGNDVSDYDTRLKAKQNLLARIPKKHVIRRRQLSEEIDGMKEAEYLK